MTLLFLYGPPAVGKTTIGKKIAEQTGYRFFFNHLTVPAAKAIFPDASALNDDERYHALLHQLRLDGLAAAADAGFDTIFTLAYSGEVDNAMVAEIADLFTARGGRVCFAELHAPEDVLLWRVIDPARAALKLGKMTSRDHLRHTLNTRDMFASVPYSNVLRIDTGITTPSDAARQIIETFDLV